MRLYSSFRYIYSIILLMLIFKTSFSAKTYYEVLNLKRSASIDDIKQHYRSLAKQYHPDKNKNDPKANEKFIEITKAYEILGDDAKRREYDLSLPYSSYYNNQHKNRQNKQSSRQQGNSADGRYETPFETFNGKRNTYAFRAKNGQFVFQSSTGGGRGSQSQEEFMRQYFQDQYDYHQQQYYYNYNYSSGYGYGLFRWMIETFHIFLSICVTMAIPLTAMLLLLSLFYQGCSNLMSSIAFRQQQQKFSSSYTSEKSHLVQNRNLSKSQSKISSTNNLSSKDSSKLAEPPTTPTKPQNSRSEYSHKEEDDRSNKIDRKVENSPEFQTPMSNHPRNVLSTPEERAIERLRNRHLDETGVICVVALTIPGWNLLTQIKPMFHHDKHVKFLQHVNGKKIIELKYSDSDIIALVKRGSKWTSYYIASEEEEEEVEGDKKEEEEEEEGRIQHQSLSEEDSSFNITYMTDITNITDVTDNTDQEENSFAKSHIIDTEYAKQNNHSPGNVYSSMYNVNQWNSIQRKKYRSILYDARTDVEEWIVKLLNGEITLNSIDTHPLPIAIEK